MSKLEKNLEIELAILRKALECAQREDKLGVIEQFAELCLHQQNVMEQEAIEYATQAIETAQRNARSTIQARLGEGISKDKNIGKEK